MGDLKKFDLKFFLIVILFGLIFGLLFYFAGEPLPNVFLEFTDNPFFETFLFVIFTSFAFAVSEQIIFSGFLFNVYKKLDTKISAIFQVSLLFTLFHLLRLNVLLDYYAFNFYDNFLIYISIYYILLFGFMTLALYLYSFKNKKFEGNFIYPLTLHFFADFSLFFYVIL